MVFFNYSTMQMAAKVVYYGPGLCGKTTNLQWIFDHTARDSRGEMVSLATETDRTLFFDLLPIDVGTIAGFNTRIQLYTVPGQVFYNTTRKLVLKGVDGVVFVADSQRPMVQANIDSLNNLEENLAEMGLSLETIPVVLQYNKRDLPNVMAPEELDEALKRRDDWPSVEASAITGEGVFETLKVVSKSTLLALKKRLTKGGPGAGASRSMPSPGARPPLPKAPLKPPGLAPRPGQPLKPPIAPPPLGAAKPLPKPPPKPAAPAGRGTGPMPRPATGPMPRPAPQAPVEVSPELPEIEPIVDAEPVELEAVVVEDQPMEVELEVETEAPPVEVEVEPMAVEPEEEPPPTAPEPAVEEPVFASHPELETPVLEARREPVPAATEVAVAAEAPPVVEEPAVEEPVVAAAPAPRPAPPLPRIPPPSPPRAAPPPPVVTAPPQPAPAPRRKPRLSGIDALAELEKLRRQALHPKTQRAAAAPHNGRGEITREVEFTIPRADLQRARRFALTLQLEDGAQRVVDEARQVVVEIEHAADLEHLRLRFSIALNTEEV